MSLTWNLPIDEIIRQAHKRAFDVGDQISGIQAKDAVAALNMCIVDLINRGAPLSTYKQYSQNLVYNQSQYTLPSSIVDVWDMQLVDSSSGIPLYFPLQRISLDDYAMINNKESPGRPGQWALDRQISAPILYIYLPPDQTYSISYYAVTRQSDVAGMTSNIDLSYRFTPALVSGLAYYMLMGSPKDYSSDTGARKMSLLQQNYERELTAAFNEDRERVSVFFEMRLGF